MTRTLIAYGYKRAATQTLFMTYRFHALGELGGFLTSTPGQEPDNIGDIDWDLIRKQEIEQRLIDDV